MIKRLLFIICFAASAFSFSQEFHSGEIIKDYGKIYSVENPSFKTDTTATYKVVFDVGRSFDNPSQPNALIETAARFINMHREAGVPVDNIQVALVIHGAASTEILKDEFYNEKFPQINTNPNSELISQLADQGVQIILCGQTAAHRKITKNKAHPDVQLSLSAMTALIQLQNDGYRLINF